MIDDEAIEYVKEKMKALRPPAITEEQAYSFGYDCGKNGANLQNCSFAIFSSPANRDAWIKGKFMGEASATKKVTG